MWKNYHKNTVKPLKSGISLAENFLSDSTILKFFLNSGSIIGKIYCIFMVVSVHWCGMNVRDWKSENIQWTKQYEAAIKTEKNQLNFFICRNLLKAPYKVVIFQ